MFATGCANSAWKQALGEDTAVAYHRFMREHPDSQYISDAQERIDFLTLERNPTLASFQDFRERYPQSKLVERLRKQLEKATFEAARAAGTPDAYEEFANAFPDGPYAARAEGNRVYLRELAHRPQPEALRQFAMDHPESDFALEAKRSAESFGARKGQAIRSVGIVIEVDPETPEARRLAQSFMERAKKTYSLVDTHLFPLGSLMEARSSGVDAVLLIHHTEEQVANVMAEGLLPKPGVLATTRVRLARGSARIFLREFELRAEARQVTPGKSVLYGRAGRGYWDDFFVPVATWEVNLAVRKPVELGGTAVAVDASGDRAVVLYENGGFEVLHLADPTAPVTLARYDRETPLENFNGVRVTPAGVAIFGDDGLELIGVAADGRQTVTTRTRGELGDITALEMVGDRLIVGGGKGLQSLPANGAGEAQPVMRRAVRGMARAADLLVLADGDTLFVSTLPLLAKGRVMGQLKIGKSFATRRIRVFGTTAVVIGDGGVVVVDLRSPRTLRAIGRMRPDRVGAIADAGRVGSSIFLVGERGLQLLGPKFDRVVEVIDAVPGRGVAVYGRHLVAVGGPNLQVIDGLPFGVRPSMSAAPAKKK